VDISCTKDNPISNNVSETVTDADSNVYHAVKIGNQIWTIENFRSTKYNDGTPIPFAKMSVGSQLLDTIPGYSFYNKTTNADTIKKFGALYNWYVINTGKLAPIGWHVPERTELDTLLRYLIENGSNYDGSITGNKIAKSLAAEMDWNESNKLGAIGNDLSKNNTSHFSALPGGIGYYDGSFGWIGMGGDWWCATEVDTSIACDYRLFYESDSLDISSVGKLFCLSVRLVHD
jgi:uncharacterized protein (TIGR02145 family)